MRVTDILHFLGELEQNNNFDWMHAHKSWQKETQAQFETLVDELIRALAEEEAALAPLSAKDLIFRLNRDTRFSHDKSPYSPAYRAHIGPAGRAPIPVGYFIVLSPRQSFVGGGLYAAAFGDATERIRQYIAAHPTELAAILHDEAFAQSFTIQGEKLKRVPRGYDPASPVGEYLKHKSWYIEYPLKPDELADDGAFCACVLDKCRLMQPFNAYINQALAGYQLPKRP